MDPQLLLIPLGLALILLSTFDMLTTVLAVGKAAGPVTSRIASTLWNLARRGHRSRRAGLMQAIGIMIVVTVILLWTLSAWIGWSLIFNATDAGVVRTVDGAAVGVWDRIYFAGYALLTLGNGDLRPHGTPWQLATVAAAANGLVFVTLGISYLVPIIAAATNKRQVAAYISSLGGSPNGILIRSWDGEGFEPLKEHLIGMASTLHLLEQRHLAYPVLHYFHSREPRTSSALRIAALDEALTVLEVAVDRRAAPCPASFAPLRQSLTDFFATLRDVFVPTAADPPDVPDLATLTEAGIPLRSEDEIRQSFAQLRERRAHVRGYVEHNGWEWEQLWHTHEPRL